MYFDSWAFKNNYPHRLRISNGIRSAEHLLDVETALDRWVTTIFHDCFYYMMFYEWDQRSQSGALALDPNWCMCFADDLIACHYQVVLGLLLSNHPCSTMIRNGKQSLRAEQTHSSFQRIHFGNNAIKDQIPESLLSNPSCPRLLPDGENNPYRPRCGHSRFVDDNDGYEACLAAGNGKPTSEVLLSPGFSIYHLFFNSPRAVVSNVTVTTQESSKGGVTYSICISCLFRLCAEAVWCNEVSFVSCDCA